MRLHGSCLHFRPIIRLHIFFYIKSDSSYEAIVKNAAFIGAMLETRRYFWL
jgi:hypothetical protein